MRSLVIEDDSKTADFIRKGMEQAGFVVDHADNGLNGLHLALNESYDVAIVDIMLPELDGLSLIARLRRENKDLPVIILSAKHSVEDRIRGLQEGGDDYLVKPFAFSELLARVQALLRRSSGVHQSTRLVVGDLTLDLLTREVSRSGKIIDLQPREFTLLEYLMRHPNQALSKTMILERVWAYDFDPQTNVVDVLVCRLRNKVDREFQNKMVRTIRGIGYVLKVS
jgi:two-component system OmpR family response regulator